MQPNQLASWAEHLPPKLASERVSSLMEAFKSNYPGELLDADTTPSIRLLSLVHEGLRPGQSLKWVPWQYRLSTRQYQERMEAKSARAVRSELQLLSQAFFDDTPEVSVEHHSLAAGWLTRIQTVFRNALARCQAAHLSNLKAFDKKIADLCLTQPDPSLGLRTVNTQELLSADRKLWAAISDLLGQQWSLDDALYELTHMRNDVHSLLQLRPKLSKPSVPAPPRPATPRQRAPKRDLKPTRVPSRPAKKGKGKSKGASPSPKPKADWCTTYKGREVCRRYQTGSCTNDHCPFAHVCAIPPWTTINTRETARILDRHRIGQPCLRRPCPTTGLMNRVHPHRGQGERP